VIVHVLHVSEGVPQVVSVDRSDPEALMALVDGELCCVLMPDGLSCWTGTEGERRLVPTRDARGCALGHVTANGRYFIAGPPDEAGEITSMPESALVYYGLTSGSTAAIVPAPGGSMPKTKTETETLDARVVRRTREMDTFMIEPDADVVARRIVILRQTWDRCVDIAEAIKRDRGVEVSPTDVLAVAAEGGLDGYGKIGG
jgi:hypothetical protein